MTPCCHAMLLYSLFLKLMKVICLWMKMTCAMACNQGVMHVGKTSDKGLSEGTLLGLLRLQLRLILPDQDMKIMISEVDSWPKMPDQACKLITLITAHTFAYKPEVFLPWAQSFLSFKSQTNGWVCGQLPLSRTPRLTWWVSPPLLDGL